MEEIFDRTYLEIEARYKLEPTLKDIYVEGVSDKYLIEDVLDYNGIIGISVYNIGLVDFSKQYEQMSYEDALNLKTNCKNRVVFLSMLLENAFKDSIKHVKCVVDVDLDLALGLKKTNHYLIYTDFNSIDMYLFHEYTLTRYIQRGLRITKDIDMERFMRSIMEVCRFIYCIRIIHQKYYNTKDVLLDTKDFVFDKQTCTCSINQDSYWVKIINHWKNADREIRKQELDSLLSAACIEPRMEMKGHDFVHFFYLCIRKCKNLHMSEDELSNHLWEYADFKYLSSLPLFQSLINL